MGIITMIKAIKKIHEKDIVFVRIGKFFHIYGKDSFFALEKAKTDYFHIDVMDGKFVEKIHMKKC